MKTSAIWPAALISTRMGKSTSTNSSRHSAWSNNQLPSENQSRRELGWWGKTHRLKTRLLILYSSFTPKSASELTPNCELFTATNGVTFTFLKFNRKKKIWEKFSLSNFQALKCFVLFLVLENIQTLVIKAALLLIALLNFKA